MVGARATAPVLVGLLLVTSGCMGILSSGTSSFTATAVEPTSASLNVSGYTEASSTTVNETMTFRVGGQSRDARLTSYARTYERSLSSGDGLAVSRVSILAMPLVEFDGERINPADSWSDQRMATRGTRGYAEVTVDGLQDRRGVYSMVSNTQVVEYSGQVQADGEQRPARIHVTSFATEDTVVVAVAVHPPGVQDERERIDRLLAGLGTA